MKSDTALQMVASEVARVEKKFKPYKSAHEGVAVMFEEFHELWDEVRKHDEARSSTALRTEAVHVAVTAVRFLMSCCDEE